MPTPDQQPFFTVRIDISGCRFTVSLNDVPLFENPRGFPLTVELPVNQYMISGANELSFALKPADESGRFDEGVRAMITLKSRRNGAPRDTAVAVTGIVFSMADAKGRPGRGLGESPPSGKLDSTRQFSPSPLGDVTVEEVVAAGSPAAGDIKVSRKVTLTVPFPPWVWLSSQTITINSASQAELLAAYQAFWKVLSARDATTAMARCETKLREIGAAFYLNAQEARDYIQIDTLLNDDDVQLYKFVSEGVKMQLAGNNRLARLVSRKGQSPIVFVEKDHSAGHYVELWFCRTAKEWLIVR